MLTLILSSCGTAKGIPVEFPAWRGTWVQLRDVTTSEKIDNVLKDADTGGFNALFVNVFYDGQSLYDSALVEKNDKVESGFDPLKYLVSTAHARGIQVHAWFVVGRIDDPASPIFQSHPNWSLVRPDGDTVPWLNLAHPDVQRFVGELMLETVEHYGVDGIHFDYTRFPGPEWGFDPYTLQAFATKQGIDPNQLRYTDLPAYGLFEGNPLISPDSAKVLANFSNGIPAITINRFGEGEAILFNWKANQRTVTIASEIMQNGLERLVDPGGQVYLLRSETNVAKYGSDGFEETAQWLNYLGWQAVETSEANIEHLHFDSVVVLPNVYLISAETAVRLANFVQQGGGVVLVDGPTKSIHLPELQSLTGMRWRGVYFRDHLLMTPGLSHPLIPVSERNADPASYREWDASWRVFRMNGITELLRAVHDRVKARHPEVTISVTVTSDQLEANEKYLQDWETWLQEGYVDLLIPRGYVDQVADLRTVLEHWLPVFQKYSHKIVFGVISYTEVDKTPVSKTPEVMLEEIRMTLEAGSNGFLVFDLGRTSNDQLSAVKSLISALPIAREGLSGSQ